MVRIPREPVLKALRTTIPEVRVEMIIRCFFFVNVFMTLSQDEDFLKYLTDPASRKAKPHCMKNMTIALKHIQISLDIDLKQHHPQVGHWKVGRRTGGQQQRSSSICLTRSLVNNKTVKKLNLVLRASTACCSFVSCSSLLSSSTFLQGQSIKFPWVLFHWSPSSSVI